MGADACCRGVDACGGVNACGVVDDAAAALMPVALMLLLRGCADADAAAAVLVGACSNISAPAVVLVPLPLNQHGSVVAAVAV